MGNEVSAETIAAASAASAAAAAAPQQQEQRKEQGKSLGDTAQHLEIPPQDGNKNTKRSGGAEENTGISNTNKEIENINKKDDENGTTTTTSSSTKNFHDAAAATPAVGTAPHHASAAAAVLAGLAATPVATAPHASTTATAAAAAKGSEDSDKNKEKDEGEEEDSKTSKNKTPEDEGDDKDSKDTVEEKLPPLFAESSEEEDEEEKLPPLFVETVVEEEDEDEDEDEAEDEEVIHLPQRKSNRIKARQEAEAKASRRAFLLSERSEGTRASKNKKDLIEKAKKAGTEIREAFKKAGKLRDLEEGVTHILERKGIQQRYALRKRDTCPLPTRKRSEEEAKNNKVQQVLNQRKAQAKPTTQEKRKAQQEETKKGTQANKSKRRKVSTRPTSVNCVKDRTVRAKFTVASKHLSDLQYCSTWESKIDRDEKPKSQHFMFTFDEMVQKPHCSENSRIRRPEPSSIFLCPEDCKLKELGRLLLGVGKAMVNKTGKGYQCTTNPDEYHDLVFGERDKKLNR